ncbi:hypothetical protein BV20DRAFT_336295 [Pilatotrama ljubarskyi]|nr:hypothetical protein BV20DRAFT_336295 [Pilatotrama ljubarskyi]
MGTARGVRYASRGAGTETRLCTTCRECVSDVACQVYSAFDRDLRLTAKACACPTAEVLCLSPSFTREVHVRPLTPFIQAEHTLGIHDPSIHALSIDNMGPVCLQGQILNRVRRYHLK